MRKLLLAVVIIALISILLFKSVSALQPPPRWGWDAQQYGDFYFQPLPCGTIEVWYDGSEAIAFIPSEIEGYVVTQLGSSFMPHRQASDNRFGRRGVLVIPESVTAINDNPHSFHNMVIYGYSGSFAEKFASSSEHIVFLPLDNQSPFTMFMKFMNGNWIEFDEPPFVDEGVIFVPLRLFFENIRRIHVSMKAESIIWDDETQTVTIELYDWFGLPPALFETVKVTMESDTFSIDGNTLRGSFYYNPLQTNVFELEAPPRMVNNRVFVPLSFFLDYFAFAIYDKTIIKNICEEQEAIGMAVSTLVGLSEDEAKILCERLVYVNQS